MLLTKSTTLWASCVLAWLIGQDAIDIANASAAGTETLVGIVGRDFVMVAADRGVTQSIVLTCSDVDKIRVVADPFPEHVIDGGGASSSGNEKEKAIAAKKRQAIAVAAAGDLADVNRLFSTLKSHAAIREYETSLGADVDFVDLKNEKTARGDSPESIIAVGAISTGLSVGAIANLARTEISQSVRSRAPYRVGLLVAGMQHEGARTSNRTRRRKTRMSSSSGSISGDVQQQLLRATSSWNGQDKEKFVELESNGDDSSSAQIDSAKSKSSPCLYWLDEYGALQKIRYASHGMASSFLNAILDRNYREDLSREQAAELIQSCFDQLQTRYVINSPQPPLIKCIDASGCRVYQRGEK